MSTHGCNRRGGLFLVCALVLSSAAALAHPAGDDSLAVLNRKIRHEPPSARLYLARGDVLRGLGDRNGALADYDRAARHDPDLDLVDYSRGLLFLEAGRPAEAEPFLRRFLAVRPMHAEARVARARALAGQGRPRLAAVEYTRALGATSSPSADVYLERADALVAAGDADGALQGLTEGLAALGPLTALERRALEIEIEAERYDAALARLATLAGRSPLRERWLMRRGEVLEAAGRTDEARAAYREVAEAIEARPANRRETRALQRLERELQATLARLSTEIEGP